MILTYKIKHHQDFSAELKKAKKIAEFAIKNRDRLSTSYVSSIGLKSVIANQILREYGKNKKCNTIKRIKLIVPNQGIKFTSGIIEITSLKLQIPFGKPCTKINQVEIDPIYCYVSVTVPEEPEYNVEGWLGVDRNTTGHCAVAACTKTSKVLFLGKKSQHIHEKYKHIRKSLQRSGKLKKLKAIKRRESSIQTDLNHKLSRRIVDYAKQNQCGIKMEELEGIRKRAKQAKSFKYSLNSWSYYQLQTFVDYKSKLAGVPVVYVAPHYTSQLCHKCGLLGNRNGKVFKCPHCGYTSHADSNAGWNIAYREKLLGEPHPEHCTMSGSLSDDLTVHPGKVYTHQFLQEGDCRKGNSDVPQKALMEVPSTLEP